MKVIFVWANSTHKYKNKSTKKYFYCFFLINYELYYNSKQQYKRIMNLRVSTDICNFRNKAIFDSFDFY